MLITIECNTTVIQVFHFISRDLAAVLIRSIECFCHRIRTNTQPADTDKYKVTSQNKIGTTCEHVIVIMFHRRSLSI